MPYLRILLVLCALAALSACRKKGCTDSLANNFSDEANFDDGTCQYTYGCTDAGAVNFDSAATIDDGTCLYEFVADDATFADFTTWTFADSNRGPDPFASGAHGSSDSTVLRSVFVFEGAQAVNQEYPVGTRIVKLSQSNDGSFVQLTAMAKRGNGFAPAFGDWEWFILNADGSIATDTLGNTLRGPYVNQAMGCANCHGLANTDFVFTQGQ